MIDLNRLLLIMFYCDRCGALYLFADYNTAETALADGCQHRIGTGVLCGGTLHSLSELPE